MNFVDVSGFGHSGKSVVSDILREFEGFQVPSHNFEFNLIRIQGGLIDLKHALVDNWSPIRSDAAIRRFIKLVHRIGPPASFSNPKSLFYSNGMNYDNVFKGRFSEISEAFVRSLIYTEFLADWPYPLIDDLPSKQFLARFRNVVSAKKKLINVMITDPKEFEMKATRYLQDLFGLILEDDKDVMVLHNAVEPFNPRDGLFLLGDAKLIVVQRDPRDIFASTIVSEGAFIPDYETKRNWELKRNMLGNTVDLFIERQKLYYDHVQADKDNDHVLRLRYEDIILDYNNTLKRLYDFLNVGSQSHELKGEFFNPLLSKKNIGLWKSANPADIKKIKNALSDYCYDNG